MASPTSFQPPRKLRVFAFDPAVGNRHSNHGIRELTLSIPWDLDPIPPSRSFFGPDGEYLQVIDYDPASDAFYEPINLNAPDVLFNNGLHPPRRIRGFISKWSMLLRWIQSPFSRKPSDAWCCGRHGDFR